MMNICNIYRVALKSLYDCYESIIRNIDTKLAAFLRQRHYKTRCSIDTSVYIKNIDTFTSGFKSCLYHGCYILNTNGYFRIGNNSHLGAFCYVNVYNGSIDIGNDVAIGPGTKIIAYSNHYMPGKKVTESKTTQKITIHDNVFIGANCVILPGTIIHNNVIVGAGSIVKGELESNSIYAGAPCKKTKLGWYE